MPRSVACWVLLSVLGAALAGAAKPSPEAAMARAQELLDEGRPEEALELLEPLAGGGKPQPRALMLRGTARLMIGKNADGQKDLERSLALDPNQRQGWLNLAGLHISERRYDQALVALERAQQLDPQALDNALNIGAVMLLQGKLPEASQNFTRYLGQNSTADGYYLVATNYALAGYNALAVQHLKQAVTFNERARLRARTDANFAQLSTTPQLQDLLATDSWTPPAGALRATQLYPVAYDGKGKLLNAVLTSLQLLNEPFDPRVEVTADWALIWAEFRVKVSAGPEGKGQVELFAGPGQMTPAQWQQRTERLFRDILLRLAT